MWQLEKSPQLFIDSRYYLFSDKILADYWTMALCHSGWQDLLAKYDIAWIFCLPIFLFPKRCLKVATGSYSIKTKWSVVLTRSVPQPKK